MNPNSAPAMLKQLADIDLALIPLKELADRELRSIYGLRGKVYTPHFDTYIQKCITKSEVVASLKQQGILELSEVELITNALDSLYKNAKNQSVVDYEGAEYQRRFLPLKLNKSGKTVQRWGRVWLLKLSNGEIDPNWEQQVREIWPKYYVIRAVEL